MSEDLVKRLRDHIAVSFDDRGHVFEDEVLCDDAAHRIEELEANLAKAVDVDLIEQCIRDVLEEGGTVRDAAEYVASATLAELTGSNE